MIQKNTPPELITAREAAELSKRHGTLDDIYRADDIYNAFYELKDIPDKDFRFAFLCAIGTVYAAGRIQGIREERRKKHD